MRLLIPDGGPEGCEPQVGAGQSGGELPRITQHDLDVTDSPSTNVSIQDLRRGLRHVLDAAERRFGPMIDLQADVYWTLDAAAAYAPMPPAQEDVLVDQLTDNVASLHQLLKRADTEPVTVCHDLTHLTGILARITALDRP
jgi:hypothetical protein